MAVCVFDCVFAVAVAADPHPWHCLRQPTLPATHPIWQLCAFYLGVLTANLVLAVSPERVVLGGGVMLRKGLIMGVRREFVRALGGFSAL
jgi:fructokinase